ncbi:MAG TPA: hypothetical protein VGX92_07455 [Pyrinomonadaceae bacterium]|nr:hypothetical protein [Pyrinomonadaceae bacterium]
MSNIVSFPVWSLVLVTPSSVALGIAITTTCEGAGALASDLETVTCTNV